MDPVAFYGRFLTGLCYGKFQSDSQDRGWKTCSWTSHFHLRRSAVYPHVQCRKCNPPRIHYSAFNGKSLQRGIKRSRPFSLAPRKSTGAHFFPSQLTSAHLSPACWGCVVWILEKLIKRSTIDTASLQVGAAIAPASYFSSWLIVFNSLPCYLWFTGTCKSAGIDWVSYLNNAFDCL